MSQETELTEEEGLIAMILQLNFTNEQISNMSDDDIREFFRDYFLDWKGELKWINTVITSLENIQIDQLDLTLMVLLNLHQ